MYMYSVYSVMALMSQAPTWISSPSMRPYTLEGSRHEITLRKSLHCLCSLECCIQIAAHRSEIFQC
jgi:hypothetical protein